MELRELTDKDKTAYNKLAGHVMQSWEWGQFRQSFGTRLKRYGIFKNGRVTQAFQITFHPIPFTKKFVGYFPKGPLPDQELIAALTEIGQRENCAFIKLEPNVIRVPSGKVASATRPESQKDSEIADALQNDKIDKNLIRSPKPLFTKYNFILDLTQSEVEILNNMHPKTRYNIRLAEKKGVKVEERTDDEGFQTYLKLYFETTKRQQYHGHNQSYHQSVWKTMKDSGMARILLGFYQNQPLTAWMLFNFKDTLYYPYGGSLDEHREVMHSNLVAWEAIKIGKRLGCKSFDMWGALGPNADPKDPWFGFHRFKQNYGGRLVEYIGTFDLVFDYPLYWVFTLIDKLMPLKVLLLKLLGR